MATKTPRKSSPSTLTIADEILDAFGLLLPDTQPQSPASGISEIYGIPETLLDGDDEGPAQDMVIKVRARKSWSKPKGRNYGVAFPHLSRENPAIKELADTPATANRFCVIRDGRPYNPHSVNREIDPRFDFGAMGSLRDTRFALTLLVLDPPIEAIACYPPDGEPVYFPIDPEAKPIELERADNEPDTHSPAEVPTGAPEVNSGASSLGDENAI